MAHSMRPALTIAGIYALFGIVWIVVSDNLLMMFVAEADGLTRIQTFKGWGFVVVTTWLVFYLALRALRHQAALLEARRQTVEQMRSSERLFRGIFEQAAVGIAQVGLDGRWLRVNDKLCQILGYTSDELLLTDFQTITHPEDLDDDLLKVQQLLHGDFSQFSMEKRYRRKDGDIVWTKLTVALVRDDTGCPEYFVSVLEDANARKQVEAALRESENRYRQLFQVNPQPMWVYDLETLAFLDVNEAAVRHYGYSRDEFLSMRIADIRPQEDVPALLRNVANVTEGPDEAGLWRHLTRDGRLIDVDIHSHTLEFAGRKAELVLALDVTARRQAEAQIRQLNTTLESRVRERTAQLEAVNRELETFSYSVSHDLKAPLRAVDGYSQLLLEALDGKVDAEASHFVANIRNSAQRMNALIDGLLAYSRMERRAKSCETLDLQRFVQQIADERRDALREKSIDLQIRVPRIQLQTDSEGLAQALRNLLDNAIKFSAVAEQPRIRIHATPDQDHVLLSISDNGIGFDAQFNEKIFEIFQRLEDSREYPGTGIGLALVRKAAERMGGRIWAEGKPGQGATFSLELPLQG